MDLIRIIIAGGRDFNDMETLEKFMFRIISAFSSPFPEIEIISGGANGADKLGEKYAKKHGYKCHVVEANWTAHDKRAGAYRNEEMAKLSVEDGAYGVLVAFWNGRSSGTRNMIQIARKYKVRTFRYIY